MGSPILRHLLREKIIPTVENHGWFFSNVSRLTGLLGLENDCKRRSAGCSTLLCTPHMGAPGDISWTLILIGGNVNTPLACHRKVKAKSLPIYLHSKKIQALSPGSKVLGLFRSVQFRFFCVEESIEDVRLILFCNADSIIRNMEYDFSMLLLDH